MLARRLAATAPLLALLGMAPGALAQSASGETKVAATQVTVEPDRPPEAPPRGYLEVGEGLAAALESPADEKPEESPAPSAAAPVPTQARAKPRAAGPRPTSGVNKDSPLALVAGTLDRSGTNISTTLPDR